VAGNTATLSIRIVSDASRASAGFADAEARVGKFQRGLDRASVAATGILGGIAAVGKAAFDSASALEQSSGAVASVFGEQEAAVRKLADGASQAVGLSKTAYNELASVMGAQLQNMGFETDASVAKTNELISVGADLAATFGGTTSDAVSALSSLLRGERDPIEQYGIAISQAAVDAQIGAMGLDVSTDAAKRNAQAQATLALVADQSSASQGAFARESDTAAGAQQRAAAEFENAKASLGDVLLPIVTDAMTKFSEFTTTLTEHETAVTAVVTAIAALAAGVLLANIAIKAYRTLVVVSTALQWLWNTAMFASPLTWIVLAIMAVIAIVIVMYNKFDWFKGIVDSIGDALMWAFDKAKAGIQWVIDKLSFVSDAASWVGDLFSSPMAVHVTGDPSTAAAAGLFGAAANAPVPAIRGAALSSPSGGPSPSTGRGPAGTVVNVTVNGALDPVAVGRQIDGILRRYGAATGRQVSTRMAR